MEDVMLGPHVFTFETGKLARFASGAVLVGIKNTKVLATVVTETKTSEKSFVPLQVDYREKQCAQGKIPNTFLRREGAPKEREFLVGRMIDKSVRPLFPRGFFYETQIMGNVLCVDGKQDPDVLCANAASAALTISDVPWNGPVGVVRIGRVNGHFLVNPDMDELSDSDLNLVYACTSDKTIMIETQAREISNNDLKTAFCIAHEEAKKLIPPQLRLASKVQNEKRQFTFVTISKDIIEKIRRIAEVPIKSILGNPSYGKLERGKALTKVQDDVANVLRAEADEESLKVLPVAFDQVRKQVIRRNIFEKGLRVDGRQLNDVRKLYCEAGLFDPLHGSSLFSRGSTQVFCTVTLGVQEDAQRFDSLIGPPSKRFMVHYNFPPYCVNEVGKNAGFSRREIGHGMLAEKALLAVLPAEEEFPYSVRVTSEVMASDGSSSMATVCGGSLALMDAGVPLREHVAGVSFGLITKINKSTGIITDYRLLTDILGLEDHIGDMDFKIAGTKNGVTAIQLDIKRAGIPLGILCECLEPALTARMQILKFMETELRHPKLPQMDTVAYTGHMTIPCDSITRLIGPQGMTLKSIKRMTGTQLFVYGTGVVNIFARDQVTYDRVKEMVETTISKEIEVGNIYNGVINAVEDFGAFVELDGGKQGLLHISEISHEKISRVADAVTKGQKIKVVCIGRDPSGNLTLSVKAMSALPATSTDLEINSVSLSVRRDEKIEKDQTISKIVPVNVSVSCADVLNQNILQSTILSGQDNGSLVESTKPSLSAMGGRKFVKDSVDNKDAESQPGCIALEVSKKERSINLELGDKVSVDVGAKYKVAVLETRELGLVLQMSNGICGKLLYTEQQTPSAFQIGEQLDVMCTCIDKKGIPIFTLLTSKAS